MSKKAKPRQDKAKAVPVAEPRKLDDINKEYAELCCIAGDKQYRSEVLKIELLQINQRLQQLNQEAVAIQAAQQQ